MLDSTIPTTYDDAPRVVIWEMTRACALACQHCRAEAIPFRNQGELTTREAFALVDAVAECDPATFVLTGGDPFMRDDLFKIVEYSVNKGVRTAVSPSATGRVTPESLRALVRAGCERISLSLDAPDAAGHDAFRGVRGSFDRTLRLCEQAAEAGLSVQINTTIGAFNHTQIVEMAALVAGMQISLWSVFFLVPVGRAGLADMLDAEQTEQAFATLYALSRKLPFPLKTTEAPHYRRYVLQHGDRDARALRLPGIGDGRGFVFISHLGEVWPSGFLPHACGNVRNGSLLDMYRNDPFLRRLRTPDDFTGKCGVCEFRSVCGGSRARAYTVKGDAFTSDPACSYIPAQWKEAVHV
ncbi:MAG TPA: radical SAM protein [Candidatus Aquilonibacter sp.]|nr:radical SAM protein [Candidatus Aquilonibacter sp.]